MMYYHFNKETYKILKNDKYNQNELATTLLILYFELYDKNRIMQDNCISELSKMGLIDYDFTTERYIVKCDIFEESEKIVAISDEFIKEYRDKFKKINKDRVSSSTEIKRRIEKLRKECDNTITDEEILKAADLHISRLRSPEYLKQADYFIWGRDCGFYIMKYIEEIRENPDIQTNNNKFDTIL